MKSKALLFATFLTLGTLVSCDKDNDHDDDYDDNDKIVYAITADPSTQNLQAVVNYTDEYGAVVGKTVDLPAKISIRESDIDNYKISGYLKTKNGSNYTGELAYSVIIMAENERTGFFTDLSDYFSATNTYVDETPAYIKTNTTFRVTWKDYD